MEIRRLWKKFADDFNRQKNDSFPLENMHVMRLIHE